MKRISRRIGLGAAIVILLSCAGLWAMRDALVTAAGFPTTKTVLKEALGDDLAGKEVVMVELNFGPGAQSPAHRHPGPAAVYVIRGSIRTQIGEKPAQTYEAGETFFEPAMALHKLTENPSETEPAKAVAVLVLDEGAPQLVLEN